MNFEGFTAFGEILTVQMDPLNHDCSFCLTPIDVLPAVPATSSDPVSSAVFQTRAFFFLFDSLILLQKAIPGSIKRISRQVAESLFFID